MKKIMTACATVMLAVAANAASVSWGSGTTTDGFKDPDGAKITTAMGYTMVVSVFSDAAGATLVDQSTSSTANGMTGAFTGKSADVLAADTTYYIQAVISNSGNVRTTDIYAFSTPATGDASVNFSTGVGLAGSPGNTWSTWQDAGTPEPEPTSALMMLFGLAGLALRRKRA